MEMDEALFKVCRLGREDLVRQLISAGANIEARDHEQATPLLLAAFDGHEAVMQVLLAAGADKEARETHQWNALHVAANQGHEAVVRALLAAGADKEARDAQQYTPLHYAVVQNRSRIVQVLLSAGATANAQTCHGKDALTLAKKKRHSDIAAMVKKVSDRQAAFNECLICKAKTTLRCRLCRKVAFCSRVCQKAGWKTHKGKCCA
mmetsp:Transcript_38823/g.63859  ORF Transcript_38823/g.63859 Transcript_38823/m.63859 type:complete len:206 (+) Transcript_38823:123-740(+)